MRRSAAPSQISSKKPRFMPPFSMKNQQDNSLSQDAEDSKLQLLTSAVKIPSSFKILDVNDNEARDAPKRNTSAVLDLIKMYRSKKEVKSDNTNDSQKDEFLGKEITDVVNGRNQLMTTSAAPNTSSSEIKMKLLELMGADSSEKVLNRDDSQSPHSKCQTPELQIVSQKCDVGINNDTKKYYSVVWGKMSMKKMPSKNQPETPFKVFLYRHYNEDIQLDRLSRNIWVARASGYKIKELNSLEEGSQLSVGGKQCEIQSEVSSEEYVSGRCFLSGSAQVVSPQSTTCAHPVLKTFFTNTTSVQKRMQRISVQDSPLFPNSAPDALVMPRPSSQQQWSRNKENFPIIDVVVDPLLSRHLRPHQKEGVVFLYECIMGMRDSSFRGAILADEMGLGKTLQCIALIWTLLKQGPYGGKPVLKNVIVITPSSLVKNWVKEFKKWLGSVRLQVFAVDQRHKVKEYLKTRYSYPVLIISYEMFIRSYEDLSSVNFGLAICDEGHRLKNAKIKTTSLIANLSTSCRILLTGTPIQNDLQEFYSIADFCNPGILGTLSSFHRVFEEPILQSQQPDATDEVKELGEVRSMELNQMISRFVLRRTQDVINAYLPDKVEAVVFCMPSALQVQLYRQLLGSRTVRDCLSSFSCFDSSYHLMCIAALRKLCNHPLLLCKVMGENYADSNENVSDSIYSAIESVLPSNFKVQMNFEKHSGKMAVLVKMLEALYQKESKEKIVLVSSFTKTLDILQQLCLKKNYDFVRLDGSTAVSARQNIVESFNSPHSKTFIFLLSSKAGGVGLNLIGASRILLYDIDWNPACDLQAMARVWRDGQKKKVYIYRLLTVGTIEEKMYQRQITKQALSGAVVDSKDKGTPKFSLADLKDLFSFQENTLCTTHDLLGCNCNEEECNPVCDKNALQGARKERKCQLGQQKYLPIRRNPGMEELMRWIHIRKPFPMELVQDDVLCSAKSGISFIFKSEQKKCM